MPQELIKRTSGLSLAYTGKEANSSAQILSDNKYMAAMNRFNIVINEHPKSKFTPEALYRTSEIYYSIGMIEESTKTASILGHNFPNSEWYKFSYNNLVKQEKKSIFSKILNK